MEAAGSGLPSRMRRAREAARTVYTHPMPPRVTSRVSLTALLGTPVTDAQGHLLKADQRGLSRPNTEDRSGCDMGAYERQSD